MQAEQFEFSRVIDVTALSKSGRPSSIEANAEERAQLLERLGLHDLESFSATFSMSPWRGSGVSVKGKLHARVVQTCVVSLDLLINDINESFDLNFLPQKQIDDDLLLDQDSFDNDVPEPLGDGRIDIGDYMVQLVALALDPYPRKPVADLPSSPHARTLRDFLEIDGPVGQEEMGKKSPFSVLKRLKGQDS